MLNKKDYCQKFHLLVFLNDIVEICRVLNFVPTNIIEVGIGTAEGIQTLPFIQTGAKAQVFEPHPAFYQDIISKLNIPTLKIYNKGIYKEKGVKRFYEKWACTFIEDMYDVSGAKIQDNYVKDEKDVFECECDTIDNYDDGTIDLLIADCEGCEWFIIERLKSRPIIITLETHSMYSHYITPDIKKIHNWMDDNKYTVLAANESDTVWIKTEYLNKTMNININSLGIRN